VGVKKQDMWNGISGGKKEQREKSKEKCSLGKWLEKKWRNISWVGLKHSYFSSDLFRFWCLGYPRVRGLGWRCHARTKNLP